MLICTETAAILKEPNGAELDDEAWYGQECHVLSEAGPYLRIRMGYGYEGYVLRQALADKKHTGRTATVLSTFLDVMEEPSFRSRRLLTLPRGSIADVGDADEGWQEIALLDGRRGFARAASLREEARPCLEEETLRNAIAATALSYLGAPYRWGGRTPMGIDCSGLCHAAYLLNSIVIYRNSSLRQEYPVRRIPDEQKKRADLLFFEGHVALYLGEGKYVHSTGRAGQEGVRISSLLPEDGDYRRDLAQGLLFAGSIF